MRTSSERVGTVFAAGAFIVWGVLPLYWNALSRVAAIEILAHRLLWTSVTVSVFLIVLRRFRLPQLLRDRALRPRLFMSGMLLGVNWFIYIFAVNSGRVLDASMGYYINPLVSVLLGTIVLGERLTLAHGTAVLIAFAAVVFTVVSEGIVPWVA
ncbi:MAG: EamA family transporter, partial [bacterium]